MLVQLQKQAMDLLELKKDELYGWLVCTVSFFGQALSVGFFYSFGILYVAFLDEFALGEASTGKKVLAFFSYLSFLLRVSL